jgi:hypothetical protein
MLTTKTGTAAVRSFLAVLALCCTARAEMSVVPNAEPNPVIGESSVPSVVMPGAADPAYRVAEGISDGVFNFMRRHVLGAILPERLARNLKAAPRQNSAPLFDRNLRDNEARYLDRARAAFPTSADGLRPANDAQMRAWRAWAAAEQISVAVDSFKDTLVERYQLELFGEKSGAYAKDRRNWDPGFLSMAGILGGAFMYLNGIHGDARIGVLKIGIDIASGMKLREALQGNGEAKNLGALELGYKSIPLKLATEWGLNGGHIRNQRVGLNYSLRY